MQTITRQCGQCRQPFEITPEEQQWWEDFGERTGQSWHLPKNCTPCRAARRQAQLAVVDDGADEMITCVDCGAEFRFGTRDKAYYAEHGFARPRRCRFCRPQARRR